MQILRAMWEQRPPDLYPRVRVPVLLLPAEQEPRDDREREFIARKRSNVRLAEERLPRGKAVWFKDTIHDVPLQRPRDLADEIVQFARENGL